MTEGADIQRREPTSIVAIGAGNRMRTYMNYIVDHPDRARLVAVVEPDAARRNAFAERYGIPDERRFADSRKFFDSGIKVDAAFVCSTENAHAEPCLLALDHGCHVLLEKPIAQSYDDCQRINEAAKRADRQVIVCHVLRYHPHFIKIKQLVDSGRYGRIISITHSEEVGIDRATHSYVRGPMNTVAENNPMILAKCCHDIDFLTWISPSDCHRISSFGSRLWFRSENAPEGSADRCIDCKIERDCPYSAVDLYWRRRQWIANFDRQGDETTEQTIERELRSGDFGRCVYRCNNDVVDNQVVTMQMADGTIITLCMDVFTRRDRRAIDIKMSAGEIISDGTRIHATDFVTHKTETFDFSEISAKPFHGGADMKLVETFLDAIRGEGDVSAATTIEGSLKSHLLCFEAERSRLTSQTVTFGD